MDNGSIFLGVTTSPAREFVAAALLEIMPCADRLMMPCAGRFAAVEAVIGSGIDATKIIASDICLFSSIIGCLADPAKSLGELAIELGESIPVQPQTDAGADYDLAAQVMLCMRLGQISNKHLKGMHERAELFRNWVRYHKDVVEKLKALAGCLTGIRYEIKDLWQVVAEADDRTAIYVNVPTYKNGYEKMFKEAPKWRAPAIAQFDYEQFPVLLDKLKQSGAMTVAYLYHSLAQLPEGWRVIFGQTLKSGRTDYLISTFDPAKRLAVQKVPQFSGKRYAVYSEEEITDTSQITIVHSDKHTCLYYRDLFVHKLGQTAAETYFLLLIDGRVVTAFGLTLNHLRRFRTDYVYEVFGISKSSKRYFRLGKLFMLLLTSGSTKQYLDNVFNFGVRSPRGIQTSSITSHHEGKTDRSVMQLFRREKMKDGRFKVVYRADFRDDTWEDVVKAWLKQWGERGRKEAQDAV